MPADDVRPIRTALIGCGNSGRFYHLPLLREDPRFDLRVVAAGRETSLDGLDLPPGVETAVGWQDSVTRGDVDLVILALPHALHFPVARAALEAGKHVLVEKPATVRASEMDELIGVAKRRSAVLMVHHQRRWEEDFIRLLELVRSGELGTPWRISVARSHQGPYRVHAPHAPHVGAEPLPWAASRDAGGGVGRVIGPHPVDHLLTLADSPMESVSGRVARENGEDVEHWMGIDVRFRSGLLGHVEIFRRSGIAPPRFIVWGDRGVAVASDGTRIDVRSYSGQHRSIEGLRPPGTLGREIYDDLWAAIATGRPPRLSADDGRRAVEVIELAERSAELDGAALPSSEASVLTRT